MRALLSSIVVLSASVAYVAWQTLSGGTARAGSAASTATQPAAAAPTRALAQPTTAAVQPTAVPPTAVPVQPTAAQPAPLQQNPAQPTPAQALPAQPTVVSVPQSPVQPTAVVAQPTASPVLPTRVPATAVPTRAPASPTTTTATKGALHDGTWTSDAIQTNWGPIQVEMVVENGRITDVASIQYPQSRSRSLQISRYALPMYAEQVVSMQNARVNSVSGATQTARGFQQAVQTAIQKAS
jgi:uncharacterized protein with FMN-binding domain